MGSISDFRMHKIEVHLTDDEIRLLQIEADDVNNNLTPKPSKPLDWRSIASFAVREYVDKLKKAEATSDQS